MNSSQLLILGNGFDLHCGLESSYKDFFERTILDTVGGRYFLSQTQYGVSGFWERLMLEYYKAYQDYDYKWCDIEQIIYDTLWLIVYGEDDNESFNSNSGLGKRAFDCSKMGRDLDKEIIFSDPIKRFIFRYIVLYFDKHVQQRITYSEQDNLYMLNQHLLQELHNFERRFCKYIKNCIFDEQNKANENYIIKAIKLLSQLTGFSMPDYKGVDDMTRTELQQDWEQIAPNACREIFKNIKVLSKEFYYLGNVNILSFNYTALFDILGVESPCAYSNVHGKLCSEQCTKDCKESSVIFGIDDSFVQSQELNSDLRLFSKTYRKMMDTSAPMSILPPNDNKLIEIKFYGHSLSKADYSYFQSIFDYYDLYSNNNVRLIFYYSKGYEQNDAIYRLINSYGKTLVNKDQGKNLIHKLLLENRLNIVELNDN